MSHQEPDRCSPLHFYDVRSQLQRFIYQRSEDAFAAGDAARDGVQGIAELEARRNRMRTTFIEAIGGLPSSKSPLNPRTTVVITGEGVRIEKVIFESRPHVYVTANLYLPEGIQSPRGAVLFLCGHSLEGKGYPVYQTVCRHLARAGLIVLAQDPLGQGERLSYYEKSLKGATVRWGTAEHACVGAQCLLLGDGLAKYFLHDALRGIDYLCSRAEVDPSKIGVTGSSGGGTQTCMVMLCEPRIAAAAPATFVMNRRTYLYTGKAQDAEQVWPGMTALGFDHEDILMAMAPRPVRILACQYDYFPIEGTRQTVERCRRFWEWHGKRDFLSLVEDASPHAYTPLLAKAATDFFSTYLLGEKVIPSKNSVSLSDDLSVPLGGMEVPQSGTKVESLEPSALWCTGSGQIRGEIEGARFVCEENQERWLQISRQREELPENIRKEKALVWLKARVYSQRRPCELNPRFYFSSGVSGLMVERCLWWSQEGIFNHACVFRDDRYRGDALPVTIAVWDGGTGSIEDHMSWIRQTCSAGKAVLVLDVSGVGALAPNPINTHPPLGFFGVIHKLADDLIWLDDSLAALRTYDVLRSLDVAAIWPGLKGADIQCYAHGRYGLYGRLAAALDGRIQGMEVVEGMDSFSSWAGSRHYDCHDIMSVVFPGILRHCDLPELDKWTAISHCHSKCSVAGGTAAFSDESDS